MVNMCHSALVFLLIVAGDDPFEGAPGARGAIVLSDRPGLGVVPAGGRA